MSKPRTLDYASIIKVLRNAKDEKNGKDSNESLFVDIPEHILLTQYKRRMETFIDLSRDTLNKIYLSFNIDDIIDYIFDVDVVMDDDEYDNHYTIINECLENLIYKGKCIRINGGYKFIVDVSR